MRRCEDLLWPYLINEHLEHVQRGEEGRPAPKERVARGREGAVKGQQDCTSRPPYCEQHTQRGSDRDRNSRFQTAARTQRRL